MFEAHGIIRDYNAAADTATVELIGIGTVDTWITGIRIHAALNRGQLAGAIPVTVQMPDAHRLCEAVIVNAYDPAHVTYVGTTASKKQSGRTAINLDANGNGSAAVTYNPAFVNLPTLTVTVDGRLTPTLSNLTITGFTCAVAAGAANANGTVYFSWTADGS